MIPFLHNPMALPQLSQGVPLTYQTQGTEEYCAPLAIELIQLGMITDADLQPADQRLIDVFHGLDEKILVERALTRWWYAQARKLNLFQWDLHVQALHSYGEPISLDPWFCLMQNDDLPQLSLALQVEALEAELEGFGQTVVAVLMDAFRYLPEAFTPWGIYGMAQCHYWGGEADEEAWIKSMIGPYGEYDTREQLLRDITPFARADFFLNAPGWIAAPRRLHSREKLERAARSTLGKQVIEACDRIWSFVTAPGFNLTPYDIGAHPTQMDTTAACVLLRWSENDAMIRVLDDYMQDVYNCGEYTEFISALPVRVRRKELGKYFNQMETMVELASRVERLLQLIAVPSEGPTQ